jgi:hypothetical protein
MTTDAEPETFGATKRLCLIASERLLATWSEHATRAAEVVAISDADLSYAIDVIRAMHPPEIVLEETLAVSARGAPLMSEMRQACRVENAMIWLLSPSRVAALTSSHPGSSSPRIWLTAVAHPLPRRPPQRARRIPVTQHGEVLIDGHAATAIDLSPFGAQVRSARAMRPNARVRFTFCVDGATALTARIVWSVFELTPSPTYRAGLEFSSDRIGATELRRRV